MMQKVNNYIVMYLFCIFVTLLWSCLIQAVVAREVILPGVLAMWPISLPAFILSVITIHFMKIKSTLKKYIYIAILNLLFIIFWAISIFFILDFLGLKIYN